MTNKITKSRNAAPATQASSMQEKASRPAAAPSATAAQPSTGKAWTAPPKQKAAPPKNTSNGALLNRPGQPKAASLSGPSATSASAKIAPPSAKLWHSDEVVKLGLKVPLSELFERKGEAVDDRAKVQADGELMVPTQTGTVKAQATVKLRGNTSLTDLEFPKLKIKVKSPLPNTAFDGVKDFAIGTHGGEGTKPSKMGRLANETAPHRESAVYNTLEEMGIPVRQSRAGRIAYEDSGTGQKLERNAFFLEDIDDTATRLGGKEVDLKAGWKGTVRESLGYHQVHRVALAEALIGNFDWKIDDGKTTGGSPRAWNVSMVEKPDGKQVAVPYDFDLSTMVTGAPPRQNGNDMLPSERFFPEKSERCRSAIAEIVLHRKNLLGMSSPEEKLEARKALLEVAADLKTRQSAVLKRLESVPMDDAGRKNAIDHVQAFYEALDTGLNVPIVTDRAEFFSDSDKKQPLGSIAFGGSPLQILERDESKQMVKVLILSKSFSGTSEAWISASAIDPAP
jgi:hypothetical protein